MEEKKRPTNKDGKTFIEVVDGQLLVDAAAIRLYIPPEHASGGVKERLSRELNPCCAHDALAPVGDGNARSPESTDALASDLYDRLRHTYEETRDPETHQPTDRGCLAALWAVHIFPRLLDEAAATAPENVRWVLAGISQLFEERQSGALARLSQAWEWEKAQLKSVRAKVYQAYFRRYYYRRRVQNLLERPHLPMAQEALAHVRGAVEAGLTKALGHIPHIGADFGSEAYWKELDGTAWPHATVRDSENKEEPCRLRLNWLTRLLELTFRQLREFAETDEAMARLLEATKPKYHLLDDDVGALLGVDGDSARKTMRVRGGKAFLEKLV